MGPGANIAENLAQLGNTWSLECCRYSAQLTEHQGYQCPALAGHIRLFVYISGLIFTCTVFWLYVKQTKRNSSLRCLLSFLGLNERQILFLILLPVLSVGTVNKEIFYYFQLLNIPVAKVNTLNLHLAHLFLTLLRPGTIYIKIVKSTKMTNANYIVRLYIKGFKLT